MEKKQTPIQEAIEWHKKEKYATAGNLHQQDVNHTIDATIELLESILPKEKEFAERIWENASEDVMCGFAIPPIDNIGFNEYYKQYEP